MHCSVPRLRENAIDLLPGVCIPAARRRARPCGNTLELSLLIISLLTVSPYSLYPQIMKS